MLITVIFDTNTIALIPASRLDRVRRFEMEYEKQLRTYLNQNGYEYIFIH